MRHVFSRIICGIGVALSLTIVTSAWAEESSQPSYQPITNQPLYQPVPGSAPSGNIIGYQPIPNSALEAAVPSLTTAQPGAASFNNPVPTPLGVPGAMQPGAQASSNLPPVYLTGVVGSGFYTLGRDDVIRVSIRNQPEFSGDFVIGFDGKIQYNYLGDIPVAGMTKFEVQQILEKLLAKYIRVPVVSVTIVAYNSKVVYVIGEVHRPGKYIMRGDVIKLREAILAAGLPTRVAALSRTHVIKPDLNDPRVRKINLKKILYKGELGQDVDLHTGEIVVVPSTVLSGVNRFLSQLLNPFTRAASAARLGAAF